ncbi:hypothetical protein AMECASPLE_029783 [Ameca splendens]|uniref:Uncharacterized protein n=1 Tax=Ameca splendens TaxID=208324 RepID=A0ABV0XIX4_9TELE
MCAHTLLKIDAGSLQRPVCKEHATPNTQFGPAVLTRLSESCLWDNGACAASVCNRKQQYCSLSNNKLLTADQLTSPADPFGAAVAAAWSATNPEGRDVLVSLDPAKHTESEVQ